MKLSSSTIGKLAIVITGGEYKIPQQNLRWRDGSELVEFFNDLGVQGTYPSDYFGRKRFSRKDYALNKLNEYNASLMMLPIIREALNLVHFADEDALLKSVEELKLKQHFKNDGYKLTIKIHDDSSIIDVHPIGDKTVGASIIKKLNNSFINEQIEKSRDKLDKGDYDGVITNARSLVEAFLEEMLRKADAEIPNHKGNLITLYKAARNVLNLDPSNKDLSETLQQVLTGLISIVTGIAGVSNKTGDRHTRKYKPEKHHAKFAVNAAFTFCTFLLENHEHQQNLKKKNDD